MVYKKDIPAVRSALIKQIENTNFSMDMGVFASSMIFKVLVDADRTDIIDKMLSTVEFPSYGYMKNSGATTLWETWDGKASLNHPMFGGIVSSFYKYFGGIRYIGRDGKILIEPVFLKSADKFNVVQSGIFGDIKVNWQRKIEEEKEFITVKIELPGNIQGALKYKDEVVIVKNGLSTFIIDCNSQKIEKAELL